MQRIRLGLLGALFLVLAAAGCLEFDKQTIYFEHDQANDRLIMVVDYGGFFAEQARSKDGVSTAEQQLDEAVKGHQVAFLSNWPFVWDPADISSELANPKSGLTARQKDDLKRLKDLVTVLNAGFYTDSAGRACGAQVVVVEHVSEALDLINRLINGGLTGEADKGMADKTGYDRLAIEAARKGHKWVALDGNSLVLRLPMTEEMLGKEWPRTVSQLFGDDAGAPVSLAARLRQALSTPMFIWYQDGVLSLKVGLPSQPFRLNGRPRQGAYEPNLVDYIKTKYGFDLDARLARYLQKPDAPAKEEADRAAKLMAPRLTPQQRARVLVEQLQAAPSDALWDLLRKTPTPPAVLLHPEMASNEDLLSGWRRWLKKQAAGPDTEKEREQPERAGTAK